MNDQTMVYFKLLGGLVAVSGVVRCLILTSVGPVRTYRFPEGEISIVTDTQHAHGRCF